MDPGLAFLVGVVMAIAISLMAAMWRLPFVRHQVLEEFRDQVEREAAVTAREHYQQELDRAKQELKEREDRCRMREDNLDKPAKLTVATV